MAKNTVAPVEEQVAQLQAALDQANAQVDTLTARGKELSGFRQEAVDSRDTIRNLTSELAVTKDALAHANRVAASAQSEAKGAASAAEASSAQVAAAAQLVAALKALG